MKKLILIFALLFSAAQLGADDVRLPLIPGEDPEPEEFPRHKLPVRPVTCTISSENGVNISGVETSDIISFDVYDQSGELCLASFINDMDFVTFLFSLEGDYTLRFVTDGKTYIGYISL